MLGHVKEDDAAQAAQPLHDHAPFVLACQRLSNDEFNISHGTGLTYRLYLHEAASAAGHRRSSFQRPATPDTG